MFKKYIDNLLINKVFSFKEDKILMLDKVPFVMFPANAMAKFVQKVGEEIGDEKLYDLGDEAGEIVGKEFIKEFGWVQMNLSKRMGFIFKMFEVMGFGKMKIIKWDTKNQILAYEKDKQPVIEKAIKLFGAKEKICLFYMGIEAAHWRNEFGIKNCKLKETKCVKNKNKYCVWSHNYFKN